jgi:4-hydroxy-tetrahydrodipicolinate reductase
MKVIQQKKTIVLSVKTCILPKMGHLKKVKGIDLAEYYIFVASKNSKIMRIGLVGYGKMGKEIEKIALERGHSVSMIIDIDNARDFTIDNIKNCDAIIEFTVPSSAVQNFLTCFEAGVPVVSGTTGWLHQQDVVFDRCRELDGTFFYASNFSVGVNLFFELNRKLAQILSGHPEYQVQVTEIHHTLKLDAPSGTAITITNDLIQLLPAKRGWRNDSNTGVDEIGIISKREGNVPGTHTVLWDSDVDSIEISHKAKSRRGFALGAVIAAEFCLSRKGILTMHDLLKF